MQYDIIPNDWQARNRHNVVSVLPCDGLVISLTDNAWSPDLKTDRVYKVLGKQSLEDAGDWQYPTNALHRFFKVTVEMP